MKKQNVISHLVPVSLSKGYQCFISSVTLLILKRHVWKVKILDSNEVFLQTHKKEVKNEANGQWEWRTEPNLGLYISKKTNRWPLCLLWRWLLSYHKITVLSWVLSKILTKNENIWLMCMCMSMCYCLIYSSILPKTARSLNIFHQMISWTEVDSSNKGPSMKKLHQNLLDSLAFLCGL